MRLICALISLFAIAGQTQTLPPPYPRPGTKALIDNARAQVWDVSWPKGQPSGLHRHLYDMTGLYYWPGDRIITAVDGSTRNISTKAGVIQWQLKGITHIEEGTSEDPLRAVMLELKGGGPSGKSEKTAGVAAFTGNTMPLLDNERVTVWEYTSGSDPGQNSRRGLTPPSRHSHPMDTFVVWTKGRAGHAVFIPAGTVHTDEPIGTATKATIFELK
jgi:hypothetical protein